MATASAALLGRLAVAAKLMGCTKRVAGTAHVTVVVFSDGLPFAETRSFFKIMDKSFSFCFNKLQFNP
jgi:hypothetical protein